MPEEKLIPSDAESTEEDTDDQDNEEDCSESLKLSDIHEDLPPSM